METSSTHITFIQDWIDSLKIAILESNIEKSYELTQNLPFSQDIIEQSKNDAELFECLMIAKELIGQTIAMLENNKEMTRQQLEKMRQAKKFLI